MNVEIITIGDELLIGQVVDTNSAFLAAELTRIGITVVQVSTIRDIREDILRALDEASERAELIICTGGLGPTNDDVTKITLAEYFGSKLIINPEVVNKIKAWLDIRGIVMSERNVAQAELPDNCEIIPNSAGFAQGMWFTKNGRSYISLPGVPFEMKAIWIEELEKLIRQRFPLPSIQHLTVLTYGIPESKMADLISNWEAGLPEGLKLAYLPSPGILRLRITGESTGNPVALKSLIDAEAGKLKQIIGKAIYGYDNDTLEEIIGKLLKSNNQTLALAESCTGGFIGSMITSVPGSSAYFKGGVIAYSNEIKTLELNVSPYTLIVNGAVSQPIVEQMADGVRSRFNSDYAVAVSGIAGPDGGTEEKPVGTTWIAIATRKRIISNVYNFGEDRGRNIQKAAITALFMLRETIMDS